MEPNARRSATLYELEMAVGLRAAAKLELLRTRLGDTPADREREDDDCGCCEDAVCRTYGGDGSYCEACRF